MQDGRLLAELRQHYDDHLSDYLDWAEAHDHGEAEALLNYRRALIGWYESQLDEAGRYTGSVLDYLTTVASRYFPDAPQDAYPDFPLGDSPLDHLPESINLDERGRELLARLKADGGCLNLLLLRDYHDMEPAVVARALDLESELDELPEQIRACRYDLEASVTGGALLYRKAIRVAGRQDLMETLGRGEPEEVEDPAPAAAPKQETVRLSPRRQWKMEAPSLGIVIAGLLFGVMVYLLYDTFAAGRSPEGLFAEYFEPYPDIFAASPPTTADERDLERILYYYNRGDYRAAYEELLPAADAYPAAPLYLGVSALELGDPARAQEWLQRVDEQGAYASAAEWYRALAILAAGDRTRSMGMLRGIAGEPNHPYVDRARALLDAL